MPYVLIFIIAIVIGILIGSLTTSKQTEKLNAEIQQKNKDLDQQYQLKAQGLKNFTDELSFARSKAIQDNSIFLSELNKNTQNAKLRAEQDQKDFEEKTNSFKELKFKEYLSAGEAYRNYLISEAESDKLEVILQRHRLEDERNQLGEEIANLQKSRDALIQAAKREEELLSETNFYKIQISQKDLDDIQLLKSIENHLHNPEPLYKLIWSSFYQKPVKELLGRIIGPQKISGIYKITNLTNKKIYIGQSVDVANRLTDHIKASLGIGTISHQKIHDIMNENGLENFSFELVETCDKASLNTKEKLWIKTYQSDSYGYNQTIGGS